MIDKYLQYLSDEKNYSENTINSYRIDLEQFSDFLVSTGVVFDVNTISHNDLREWIVSLMDNGEKPASVKRKISTLRSFYKFLNRKSLTLNNPTLKIISPKLPRPIPKFFKEKDLDKCLEISKNIHTFEGIRNSLIIEIIYQTGLRCSEVVSLLDENVDVNSCQLKVLGKGNKERIIPFGSDLSGMIENYRSARDEIQSLTNTFFISTKGLPLTNHQIYIIVRDLMGMVTTQEKRSPHVLRHTFATAMLNDGADISAIKALLGHSTLAATQVYTHATFEQIKNIYQQSHPRGKKKGGNYEG